MSESNIIIFPTDFSEHAEHALAFAVDITKKTSGKLIILHVYDVPVLPQANMFSTRESTMQMVGDDIAKNTTRKLKNIIEDNRLDQMDTQIVSIHGDPKNEIIKASEKYQAGMIVMGTQGSTGADRILFGSVTQAVVQNTHCPVMAIPASAPLKALENVVWVTDLKYDETVILKTVINLIRPYQASLVSLHFDQSSKDREKNEQKLQQILENTGYSRVAYRDNIASDILKGIDEYLNEYPSDLLVMATHHTSLRDRLFHKSLTKSILKHTQIPMLIFNHKTNDIVFI